MNPYKTNKSKDNIMNNIKRTTNLRKLIYTERLSSSAAKVSSVVLLISEIWRSVRKEKKIFEASMLNITSPLYSNGGGKHKSRII